MLVYLWLIFEGKKKLATRRWNRGRPLGHRRPHGDRAISGLIGNREILLLAIKPFEFLTGGPYLRNIADHPDPQS